MKIRVAGFMKTSAGDGPGIRSVLFLQGCHRNCPGFHNSKYNNPDGGTLCELDCVIAFLLEHCKNRKLTISGGDPLEQYSVVLKLTTELKSLGFDICLYTGAERSDVPQILIDNLHYLKTGPFKQECRTFNKPFVGSSNQQFEEIRGGA